MAMESASLAIAISSADDEPAAIAAPKAPASAWYGLFVLVMATLFAYVDRQILNLVAPSLQASLGITDLQIGMLQGLGMAIFASVASYPLGWLADRFGRRLLLAIGVACWSLATGFTAFQNSFGGLFLGTIGIAVGEAGLAPIVYAMIPDLFPERQRSTANFIFYGASLLGAGAGMALAGALLQWLAGSQHDVPAWLAGIDTWRMAMMAVALPGPLFLLLVATMPLGKRLPFQRQESASADPTMVAFLPYAKRHRRALALFFCMILAMNVPLTASLTWFPLALPRAFGIDPSAIGVALGSAIAVATLIGVILPAIALQLWRGSALTTAQAFIALAAVPAAFLPFVTSPFQAYAVATIVGAMGVAASALIPGLLQDLAPPHLRARVLAILSIAAALALAASPMAIGIISSQIVGPRSILQAITIVSVPCLVAAAILMAFAKRPHAATVRANQSQLPEDQA